MSRRFGMLQRIALAQAVAPRNVSRALVMGFTKDFDFKDENAVPLALIIPSNPYDFMSMFPIVSMLFELKKIETYVVCIEMTAAPADPDSDAAKIVPKADDGEPPNAQLFLVNMADGEATYVVRKYDADAYMDVGQPGLNGLEPYAKLSPGDFIREKTREYIDKDLSDEDRAAFLAKYERTLKRTEVATASTVIAESIASHAPPTNGTVH